MRSLPIALAVVMSFGIAACGEKVQTIPTGAAKKADGQAWQAGDKRYLAPGWTPGDQGSWDAQLTKRAQGQNDYAARP